MLNATLSKVIAVLTCVLFTASLSFGVQTGGPLLSVYVQTGTTPFVGPDTTYVNVPGASLSATVPSGGALIHVTFSAECKLIGAGPFDWVEIRVMLNGSPMQPNDTVSPTALCGADSYSLNSGQWTRRVSASGTAHIVVQVRVVTNSSNTGEEFWVDDFNLKAEVYK